MVSKTHHVNFLVKEGVDNVLRILKSRREDQNIYARSVFDWCLSWSDQPEGHTRWDRINTNYLNVRRKMDEDS
jgi:hypothetical protein